LEIAATTGSENGALIIFWYCKTSHKAALPSYRSRTNEWICKRSQAVSALPHQQQLPLLEQRGLLPFLGYQLLEQCMAYLNLQLAIFLSADNK
jgi:hypothetical protein